MSRQSKNRLVKRTYLNAFLSDSSNSCESDDTAHDTCQRTYVGCESETNDVMQIDGRSESDSIFTLFPRVSSFSKKSDDDPDSSFINSCSYDDSDVPLSCGDSFYNHDCLDEPSSSSKEMSFSDELLLFFQIFNVSEKGMQYLLDVCARHGIDAPRSVYTLKKKQPKLSHEMQYFPNGQFSFIGIKESLIFAFEKCLIDFPRDTISEFEVIFNIDGLPLYNSSNISLWPILMKVDCISRPLPVAVFVGIGKPNLDLFLEKFVDELKVFTTEGVSCGGGQIKFKKILFACDAPAKSYICRIKGHNAKEACQYCNAIGEYTD